MMKLDEFASRTETLRLSRVCDKVQEVRIWRKSDKGTTLTIFTSLCETKGRNSYTWSYVNDLENSTDSLIRDINESSDTVKAIIEGESTSMTRVREQMTAKALFEDGTLSDFAPLMTKIFNLSSRLEREKGTAKAVLEEILDCNLLHRIKETES